MSEHLLYSVVGAVIAMLFSVIGFFISRMIHKNDEAQGDTTALERAFLREIGTVRERIGQVEMRIDAAHRRQDDFNERFKELREDIHRGA